MGEIEHPANAGPGAPRRRRLWAAVALAMAALLLAAWATVNGAWPWSGSLPDRACWGSLDRSLLTKAAPGDASWEVREEKDRWGDPDCTVQRGDWRLDATVMTTPLKADMWWGLGTVPLRHGLPGMIKPNPNRVDGWLRLPQCHNKLAHINVPSAGADRHAASDFAARSLLAVGNAQIARCGGKPFPAPRSFTWPAPKPVHLSHGETPCGVADARTVREWADGEVRQFGGFSADPVSRCSALEEGDDARGLGLFSALVLRDRATLDAFSPTGVQARVQVSSARPLKLTAKDLRFDGDAATELACAGGRERRYVHVISEGSDAQYTAIKRAVLTKVAASMGCH
ncbi:hypothetical protein [Streptomyces sp. bgisy084]|uniref:hypothetical protein n=1 Tax=Streptomyces sp. bgisy084 TaxID=3413777 RepID=UPI003D70C4C7